MGILLHLCVCMVPGFVLIVAALLPLGAFVPPEYLKFFLLLGAFLLAMLFPMFMPVFQVNPYIQAVIERTLGLKKPRSVVYDCQITFSPRLCRGLRRLLDDSDDVGRLEITNEGLNFHGGCVTLALPFSCIESSKKMRTKARNLWIAGGSTRIVTSDFPGISHVDFMERQSRTSWNSRRISSEIAYAIEYGILQNRAATETVSAGLP